MMKTAGEFLKQGVLYKQQGDFDNAAACYQSALSLEPRLAEASYNLGLLWRDVGRVDLAVTCLREALASRPDVPLVRFELANLLVTLGQREEGLRQYEAVLTMAPDWTAARFNHGNALLEMYRWEDAAACFQAVLRHTPQDADAWTNLGTAWKEQARWEEAESAYREAVRHQPQHAAAWTSLGNLLKLRGKTSEAVSCYQTALQCDPNLEAAAINLGNAWLELGQYERAIQAYARATELNPANPQAFVAMAGAWRRLGKNSRAIEAYQHAIGLDDGCQDAWLNLGHLLRGIGNCEEAGAMYREIARRRSSDPLARLRVAGNCPLVFSSREELDRFRVEFLEVGTSLAGAAPAIDLEVLPMAAPECPYNLQFLDGNLVELKRAFAQVYANFFGSHNQDAPRGSGGVRPRIGFVVTAGHETAFLKLLAGIVDHLDGRVFDVAVLCAETGLSRIRQGLRRPDVKLIGFSESFDRIAACVRAAACDLLYYWEIGTDPTNYFLPFLRLAPVQVTCWGIQVTSGIPTIDAYVSSTWVESETADSHYTEKLCRGSTLMTYQTPVQMPARVPTRTELGLPADGSIYGCIQNLGKFHPDFDATLAAILRRDERGHVLIGRDHFGFVTETLRRRWASTMPDVLPRIIFVPPQTSSAYLILLCQCDVLLDATHFGGVTTTYDAIALAKPVVTLPTEFHRGRYTSGCLRKIGITDTIARNAEDYVNLAVELATNRDHRETIELRLREAREGAFYDQAAVREHERIFQELLGTIR
ncbi:MAG: tetratricopeptide repeat protein [Pirellulaceae bacterium]